MRMRKTEMENEEDKRSKAGKEEKKEINKEIKKRKGRE